ncbi:LLM class flavin-dependent oxidoreductase, partial [Streptomyces sp. TRM76130]|nr:LLM class flavin-dependent oxidoreductase [Streptomyces sp. TRM76130]
GDDVEDAVARGALLDRHCADVGRDPATLTRSLVLPVTYDDPAPTREAIGRAREAGFRHLVLTLPAPYPEGVARWLADEVVVR